MAGGSYTDGWIETSAKIVEVDVASNFGQDLPYSVTIDYQYTVDGRTYTSDRYSFDGRTSVGDGYRSRATATAAAQTHFLLGDSISIYYNPESPSTSVVVANSRSLVGPLVSVFIGLVLTQVGLSTLLGNDRPPQQQQNGTADEHPSA